MSYKRLVSFFGFMLCLFAIVQLQLFNLITNPSYSAAAANQTHYLVELPSERANFFDYNLNQLTGTGTRLFALASAGAESYGALYSYVAPENRAEFYAKASGSAPFIIEVESEVEGYDTYTLQKRYSALAVAVHMLGYVGADGEGVTGLERALDSYLTQQGTKTSLRCATDALGRIANGTSPQRVGTQEISGGVVLTLDLAVQRACEAIAAQDIYTGAIVVLETQSGAVRAAVSTPTFAPDNVGASINEQGGPLVNRVLSAFNVGSVFKPLVAAAALECGYDPQKVYWCEGAITVNEHTYRCANSRVHGEMTMQSALERSCNCYFINLINSIGAGELYNICVACGLGQASELASGYYGEAGSLPTPQELQSTGQLSTFAFGQGKLLATPLQIAACYNMLAHGGEYTAPSLIAGYLDGDTLLPEPAQQSQRVISEASAEILKTYLASVVENGLAQRAQPALYSAAGKTGTAQTGRFNEDGSEIYDAWFAGFYPAEDPQYTVVVCLENGGESGETAAPIFARVCDALATLGYVVDGE